MSHAHDPEKASSEASSDIAATDPAVKEKMATGVEHHEEVINEAAAASSKEREMGVLDRIAGKLTGASCDRSRCSMMPKAPLRRTLTDLRDLGSEIVFEGNRDELRITALLVTTTQTRVTFLRESARRGRRTPFTDCAHQRREGCTPTSC